MASKSMSLALRTLSKLTDSESEVALLEKLASSNGKPLNTKKLDKIKPLFKKLIVEVKFKTGPKQSFISALEKCLENTNLDLDYLKNDIKALHDNSVDDNSDNNSNNSEIESECGSDMSVNEVVPCPTKKPEHIKGNI